MRAKLLRRGTKRAAVLAFVLRRLGRLAAFATRSTKAERVVAVVDRTRKAIERTYSEAII